MSSFRSFSFEEDDGDDWVPLDDSQSHCPGTLHSTTKNANTNNHSNDEETRTNNVDSSEVGKESSIRSHGTIGLKYISTNISSCHDRNIKANEYFDTSSYIMRPSLSQQQYHSERKPYNNLTNPPSTESSNEKFNETLNKIRHRHEKNLEMKQNFVNRPLLLFPKLFFYHLVTEFWNSSRTIRIGILFILAGFCLQVSSFAILFSFSISKLPQLIIIGFISYIVLFYLDNPISDFIHSLSPNKEHNNNNNASTTNNNNSSNHHSHHFLLEIFCTCLEYINGNVLRRICICTFFIAPILMEMRALMLLATLFTESLFTNKTFSWFVTRWITCWGFILIELLVLIPMHFCIKNMATTRNITTSSWKPGTYSFGAIVLELKHPSTLFGVRIHFWIYLYIMALISTTFMMDTNEIHKPVILAAPFLLATGSFLILSCKETSHQINGEVDGTNDEHQGKVFLNILRRALRLSLFDVIQLVGEDIAEDEILQLNILRWIVDLWTGGSACNENQTPPKVSTPSTTTTSSSSPLQATQNEVGSRNVNFFESVNDDTPTATTTRMTSGINSGPVCIGRNQSHASTNNQSSSTESTPHDNPTATASTLKLPSFIHVDERAKPAVQSYKDAVASFPPSRNVCIVLAVAQRCPATLLLTSLHLLANNNANCVTIILLPMVLLEFMRISEWKGACYNAFLDDNEAIVGSDLLTLPRSMEPMQILLSGDDFSRFNQGSSLQIWINVQGSVIALESSLTAVKCVNTANIATDLAIDVVSLAKLGLEVQQKGIPYGMSVLVKDLFQFHLEKAMNESNENKTKHQRSRSKGESYSNTAINIVNNSKILSKNIGELMEDVKSEHNVLSPIIDGLSTLTGRGWLWGKRQGSESNSSSSTMQEGEEGHEQPIHNAHHDQSETQDVNTADNEEDNSSVEHDAPLQPDFSDMDYDDGSKSNQISDVKQHETKEQSYALIIESMKELPVHNANNIKLEEVNNENTEDKLRCNDNDLPLQQEGDSEGANALGAGIAVLAGVIAGGVAFALKNDEKKRDQDMVNRRSNVTIERLDE